MSRMQKVSGGTRVSIAAPHAKSVYVAGAFNRWNPGERPLERDRRGNWVGTLDLDPGEHQYKFVVDGRWCSADGCDAPYDGRPGHVRNEFGTMNIVLRIEPSLRVERQRSRRDGGRRAPLDADKELALNGWAHNGEPFLMTTSPRRPELA